MIGFLRRRKHNRLQKLLSAYIDGEASNSEVIEVEEHLSGCDECRIELDSLRATVGLLRGLPQFDVPRSFVLTEAPALIRQRPPIVWTARLATSAAALLLFALLMGDAFGILSQTEMLQDVSRAVTVELIVTPSGAPGLPGISGQVQRSEPSAATSAPAVTAVPQIASSAAEAPPMPNPTSQPPVLAAAPQAAQAAPTPAVAAMASGERLAETPAPEMMAAPAPATADDSSAIMSTAAAPEATVIPQPLEGKVANEGTAVAPEAEIQEQKALVQATPPDQAEEQESDGVVLPLRQLEIAMGALLAVLILATLWVARPRSGQPR